MWPNKENIMDNKTISNQLRNYISYAHAKFANASPAAELTPSTNYRFNTSFLSAREQDNMYGLYLFMKCNPQITNEMLKTVIYDETNQFKTLKALCQEFHVLVQYLRADGFDKLCTSIVKTRAVGKAPHGV